MVNLTDLGIINASMLFFLLISIPCWYYTTAIIRETLPDLPNDSKTKHSIGITILDKTNSNDASIIKNYDTEPLAQYLNKNFNTVNWDFTPNKHNYVFNMQSCSTQPPKVIISNEKHIDLYLRDCTSQTLDLYLSILSVGIFTPKRVSTGDLETFKYNPNYGVCFSVLDPGTNTTSPMINAIQKYIKPFKNRVSTITNLHISSQVLLYATSPLNKKTLNPADLSHFVSSGWNLAPVTPYEPINFILYRDDLEVQTSQGKPTPTNAFLVPRWGGVLISKDVSDEDMMGIFISQLRKLLGIQKTWSTGLDSLLPHDTSVVYIDSPVGITDMELDLLRRRLTKSNLEDAKKTLTSLYTLIEEIDGMTVGVNIHDLVHGAIVNIIKADKLVLEKDYEGAFIASRDAFVLAEAAFFDPSLVSLLYFPTEHKYAVYMPFFVPALVPVFGSFVNYIKLVKKGRQAKPKLHTD